VPRLLFCSLLAASLATIAPAAPVPTHLMSKDPPFAFPTKIGTTWIYEVGKEEKTLVISRSEDEPRGKLVTTEWVDSDGNRTPQQVSLVTTKGMFMIAEEGENYDQPWCLLKFPHIKGQSWNHKLNRRNVAITETTTAGPIEQVKVPAGEFTALRIDSEFFLNGGKQGHKATHWYAHGIGMVQHSEDMKLKSFKVGKD